MTTNPHGLDFIVRYFLQFHLQYTSSQNVWTLNNTFTIWYSSVCSNSTAINKIPFQFHIIPNFLILTRSSLSLYLGMTFCWFSRLCRRLHLLLSYFVLLLLRPHWIRTVSNVYIHCIFVSTVCSSQTLKNFVCVLYQLYLCASEQLFFVSNQGYFCTVTSSLWIQSSSNGNGQYRLRWTQTDVVYRTETVRGALIVLNVRHSILF